MKRAIGRAAVAAVVLGLSVTGANAVPLTDAEVMINGVDFTATGGTKGWIKGSDTSVLTYWSNQWIEYQAELFPAFWQIGVNGGNRSLLGLDPSYTEFQLAALLTDPNGVTTEARFEVAASDTEVNHGFFEYHAFVPGTYTVRYTWLNDAVGRDAKGVKTWDANLRIVSAFFKDPPAPSPVPEPGTLLLLGSGLIGVSGLIRRGSSRHKG